MASHFHVDQRDVFVTNDPLGLETLENGRGAKAVMDFDIFERLAVILVRRAHGPQKEPAAGDGQDDGEDADRHQRVQQLAAAPAGLRAPGYDALPARSSR